MLFVQTIRLPAEGVEAFRRFEAAVLPLLPEYGARLERRLRTLDGRIEIHIVSFPSGDALDRYKADPRRQQQLHLLRQSHAVLDFLEVIDATEQAG